RCYDTTGARSGTGQEDVDGKPGSVRFRRLGRSDHDGRRQGERAVAGNAGRAQRGAGQGRGGRGDCCAGRAGVFSAGFDLKVLRAGGPNARTMLRAGFELAERMLSFPMPVVIACTGHAVAMGVFLVLSGDYRIGVAGRYKITANEVAIGITLPRAAIEICRQRLTPAHFSRATVPAEVF